MGNRTFFSTVLLFTLASTAYGETVYISASAARLRSDVSLEMDSTIIGRVGHGRSVQVLERKKVPGKGTWLRVKSGGKEGWINARITSPSKLAPASVASPKVASPAKPVAPKTDSTREAAKSAPQEPAKSAEAPKPKPTKPEAPKDTPAKPPVAKTEPAKKAPAKNNALDRPIVEKTSDAAESCVSDFSGRNKDQAAVLAPLLRSGQLHANWVSSRGAAFSLNDQGRIVVTMHALPAATIQSLVAGTPYKPADVERGVKAGVVQFNAKICKKGDQFTVDLVGFDLTDGRTGHLALKPEKDGFRLSGDISKTKFSENFHAGSAQ